MPQWPGFVGGSYPSASTVAHAERTINLFVEDESLYSVPGYTSWSSGVTTVGTRGMRVANGRQFAVIGGNLCEFDNNGTATDRGAVTPDGNPAQMVYSGVVANQLGIASGGAVYAFNLGTNVLTATTLTSGYTHLGYAHGYGVLAGF